MKRSALLVPILGTVLAGAAIAAPDADSAPPASAIRPVTELLHGVEITDPYRWLEGDNSDPARQGAMTDEVAAWTDAENAYTRRRLDGLPGREALEARLRPLMEVGSVSAPIVRADRYFFRRREGSQNQPVWYWRQGWKGEDRVLLDPAKIDPSGLTVVTWVSPDERGERVAYGTYVAGDENTTLHLMKVDDGSDLGLTIPNKVQSPDWLPDG